MGGKGEGSGACAKLHSKSYGIYVCTVIHVMVYAMHTMVKTDICLVGRSCNLSSIQGGGGGRGGHLPMFTPYFTVPIIWQTPLKPAQHQVLLQLHHIHIIASHDSTSLMKFSLGAATNFNGTTCICKISLDFLTHLINPLQIN